MALPSWCGNRLPLPPGARNKPTVAMPIRDNFHTASGWRHIETTHSLLNPAHAYRDPAIEKAIRVTDPYFTPIWSVWVFAPPDRDNERVCFGRHAVGRWVPHPRTEKRLFNLELPPGWDRPIPNQIDRYLMKDNVDAYDPRPGEYIPWSWDLYYNPFREYTAREFKERFVDVVAERKARERQAKMNEYLDRLRDLQMYVSKKMEDVSDVEIKNRLLSIGKRERVRKPFLDLGGH